MGARLTALGAPIMVPNCGHTGAAKTVLFSPLPQVNIELGTSVV
jgi:hypothetical protein